MFVFDTIQVDGRDLTMLGRTDRLTDQLNAVDRERVMTKPHHMMCVLDLVVK